MLTVWCLMPYASLIIYVKPAALRRPRFGAVRGRLYASIQWLLLAPPIDNHDVRDRRRFRNRLLRTGASVMILVWDFQAADINSCSRILMFEVVVEMHAFSAAEAWPGRCRAVNMDVIWI